MTTTAVASRVHFVEPLAGFPDEREFTLSMIDTHGLLHSLRSTVTPGLRFVLASTAMFFPDYAKRVSAAVSAALAGAEVELFVMLAIGTGLADATANLRAPIALVTENDQALQVILDDETLPMRVPLPGAAA